MALFVQYTSIFHQKQCIQEYLKHMDKQETYQGLNKYICFLMTVRATSRGCGSVTQLAKGDSKCIRIYTDNIKVATHLAEGDPKRTSLGIPYARLDASGASEAWETTVQYNKTLKTRKLPTQTLVQIRGKLWQTLAYISGLEAVLSGPTLV